MEKPRPSYLCGYFGFRKPGKGIRLYHPPSKSVGEAREHFLFNSLRQTLDKIQQDFPDTEVWIGTDDRLVFCKLEYGYPIL